LTSFFICAAVYLALSKLFPPTSTFVDRTVESLDDELHSSEHEHHELPGWEKKRSSDSESDEKVAPYNGGAPGL
jgi:NCS1 family nucleobase:cation symporter-1